MARSVVSTVMCLLFLHIILLSFITPLDAARRMKHPPKLSRWGKRMFSLSESQEEMIDTNVESLALYTTSNPFSNEAVSLKTPEVCEGPFLRRIKCIIRSRKTENVKSHHQSTDLSNQDSLDTLLVFF